MSENVSNDPGSMETHVLESNEMPEYEEIIIPLKDSDEIEDIVRESRNETPEEVIESEDHIEPLKEESSGRTSTVGTGSSMVDLPTERASFICASKRMSNVSNKNSKHTKWKMIVSHVSVSCESANTGFETSLKNTDLIFCKLKKAQKN